MAGHEYTLFRVKMIRPYQKSLLHDDLSSPEIFRLAIGEKPVGSSSRGPSWRIGNIVSIGSTSGRFALGKITRSTVEKFDTQTENFVEEEVEAGPYTHCVFNSSIGFVGIARKSSLAPTTEGLARRLKELLEQAEVVKRNGVSVEIDPIQDPGSFLNALEQAYQVLRYTVTFTGPNPYDADEELQKPLQVYLSATGGSRGTTTVTGTDLNRGVLRSVTRSIAATGNDASARIRPAKGQGSVVIRLAGDPVRIRFSEGEGDVSEVLQELESQYRRVRHDEDR